MRLDKAIFERGLAQSRSRATLLIHENSVSVNGKTVTKPSFDVGAADEIYVKDTIGYVGRGGLKLEHALDAFCVSVADKSALDIGASTGGFTQCLINRGAQSVAAVDVGHGQMHPSLTIDSRVTLFENTNARFLNPNMIGGQKDIAVMDVSFISQTEIFEAMFSCLNDNACAITLVKPQFEAGSKFLNKKGIIKDKKVYLDVFKKIQYAAKYYSYGVKNACLSPVLGGDGNIEFLFHFEKNVSDFDFSRVYASAVKGKSF